MAKPYGWIITEDHCGGTYRNRRQVVGTPAEESDLETRLLNGEGAQFRLYDGDGNLDYTGRIIVPAGEESGELWFAPLDWAKADTGSAEIRYRNARTGKWEVL
ncbi:hypothetical protein [Nonomuraea jabiensis]|uniref:hypothetical protein n=1 Tax=Nonomuraea jabiensis TaxID=882448 RepID=UPI003D738CD6